MATDFPLSPFAAKALRRTRDWTIVDDGHLGLDQVIVTPTAVLAVRHVGARDGRRDRLRVRAAARALADLLDACNVHATVTPVLMRAGSPQPVEVCARRHGVYVVDGDRPYLWRHRFAAPVIAAGDRVRIVAALALRPHEGSADLDRPVVGQARHPRGVVAPQ